MAGPGKDLRGKSVVLTGGTSGIGFAAAHELAGRGASIFNISRSAARCRDAQDRILREFPDARIVFHVADLSSQRLVRKAAQAACAWARDSAGRGLDILINNAATVSSWYASTEDGYELQFAVNYLAPFLLAHELLPVLRAAPAARIVTVSSGSHRHTRLHWPDVMLRRRYSPLLAYQQSKLANMMFTREWNERWAQGPRLRAYAADPGLVNTEIGLKDTHGLARWVWEKRRARGVTPEIGVRTVGFLAADPSVEGSHEIYWKDCRPARLHPYALRAEEAERLWALSERLCGITPPSPPGHSIPALAAPGS